MRLKRKNYSFFAPFSKTAANFATAARASKMGMTGAANAARMKGLATGAIGVGKLGLGAAALGGTYVAAKGAGALKDDIKRDNDPSDTLD